MPVDCAKDYFIWNKSHTKADLAWDRDAIPPIPKHDCKQEPHRATEQYESARRMLRVLRWYRRSHIGAHTLERLFRQETARWKKDTQHWSSITRMLAHPSYLRIIGLAKLSQKNEIERLLLEELESEPDHWFDALIAITGENPAQVEHDFDESVNAWLEWGRRKGIIGIENHRA